MDKVESSIYRPSVVLYCVCIPWNEARALSPETYKRARNDNVLWQHSLTHTHIASLHSSAHTSASSWTRMQSAIQGEHWFSERKKKEKRKANNKWTTIWAEQPNENSVFVCTATATTTVIHFRRSAGCVTVYPRRDICCLNSHRIFTVFILFFSPRFYWMWSVKICRSESENRKWCWTLIEGLCIEAVIEWMNEFYLNGDALSGISFWQC